MDIMDSYWLKFATYESHSVDGSRWQTKASCSLPDMMKVTRKIYRAIVLETAAFGRSFLFFSCSLSFRTGRKETDNQTCHIVNFEFTGWV